MITDKVFKVKYQNEILGKWSKRFLVFTKALLFAKSECGKEKRVIIEEILIHDDTEKVANRWLVTSETHNIIPEKVYMTQDDMDRLQDAISIIFEIEQKWRKGKYDYAADTLYQARTEINNARSRGQRTKTCDDCKLACKDVICAAFEPIEPIG